MVGQTVQAERRDDGASSCTDVALSQRVRRNRVGAAAVRVVHYGIERLIDPLPEYYSRRRPEQS